MSSSKKTILLILGAISALLIVSQFVMGMLILQGGSEGIRKAHQHSGYLTAGIVFSYIIGSLLTIVNFPTKSDS